MKYKPIMVFCAFKASFRLMCSLMEVNNYDFRRVSRATIDALLTFYICMWYGDFIEKVDLPIQG